MFKLELINFKSYINSTITFEENKLILLKGESGVGKTSIVKSLLFVLYNKGGRKIVNYNKNKCKVILSKLTESKKRSFQATKDLKEVFPYNKVSTENYPEYKIIRTKNPSVLKVEIYSNGRILKVLDDDVAQVFINKEYGSNFINTSYISQK